MLEPLPFVVSPREWRRSTVIGFADQSHFARHFRRVLGVTPGESVVREEYLYR